MEQDKNISFGDSYIEIQGSEKGVEQFEDDILNGKVNFVLSKKPLPKTPAKSNEKETEKNLEQTYSFSNTNTYYYLYTGKCNCTI